MKHEMPGSDAISTLIVSIMQPAMAGGMTEEHSMEIYEEIMSSIASLGVLTTGQTAFETLRDDILDKWAMHFMRPKHDMPQ